MSDIKQLQTRYVWECGISRTSGTMPKIRIGSAATLPPLDKYTKFEVEHWFDDDNMDERQICVTWRVSETQTTLELNSGLSDDRIVKALRNLPILKSEIIEEISQCFGLGELQSTSNELTPEDVPIELRPFVWRIRQWKAFFAVQPYANWKLPSSSSIVENRYTVAIKDDTIAAGLFDPKTRPTVTTPEYVYWDIPEAMVRIVLWHNNSNSMIAERFGYLDIFTAYQKSLIGEETEYRATNVMDEADQADARNERVLQRRKTLERLLQ